MSDYIEFENKMKKTAEVLKTQLASVRAGRANAAVLDQISVDYYGVPTPIQQVASVSTPDPRSLMIQPWDASVLKGIEKAILASDLGINPQNDGSLRPLHLRIRKPAANGSTTRSSRSQNIFTGLASIDFSAARHQVSITGIVSTPSRL